MALTLYAQSERGPVGWASVDDTGKVTGPAGRLVTQLIASAKARGQKPADLVGWGNGYYYISDSPDTPWPGDGL